MNVQVVTARSNSLLYNHWIIYSSTYWSTKITGTGNLNSGLRLTQLARLVLPTLHISILFHLLQQFEQRETRETSHWHNFHGLEFSVLMQDSTLLALGEFRINTNFQTMHVFVTESQNWWIHYRITLCRYSNQNNKNNFQNNDYPEATPGWGHHELHLPW